MANKFIYPRDAVKVGLKNKGFKFIENSEEFNGCKGGIWLSADGSENNYYFDYYTTSRAYENGVRKTFIKWLEDRGWYAEWNDPGTMMLWII